MAGYGAMPSKASEGYPASPSGHGAVPYGYNQQGTEIDSFQLPPNVSVDNLPLSDDGNASSLPSAPPVNSMDAIQGYGGVTFNDVSLPPPPSYEDSIRDREPEHRPDVHPVPVISEVEARDALLNHCSKKCCYGKGAAENMTITGMTSTSAFHYVLNSFGEARSTAWTFIPYQGGILDTPMNGPAPLPWDIPLYASDKFKNETKQMEVPHTASLKPCHKCIGLGRLRCHSCHGRGNSHCSCHGGYTMMGNERRVCTFCHGAGHRVCMTCNGHGHVRCAVCRGHCQLKWFIQLTVTWTDHCDDFILERTAMPEEHIRDAAGEIAFEEERQWVSPINHCPEPSVNRASLDLVNKHRTQFTSERILWQRHRIRIVPVTEVSAQWKEHNFSFFVYGLERHVYTADYPQTCCCGCSVL